MLMTLPNCWKGNISNFGAKNGIELGDKTPTGQIGPISHICQNPPPPSGDEHVCCDPAATWCPVAQAWLSCWIHDNLHRPKHSGTQQPALASIENKGFSLIASERQRLALLAD